MRTVNQATETAWSEISYNKVRVYFPELEMSVDDANIGSVSFAEADSDTDNLFFVGCICSGIELTLNDFTTDVHLEDIEVYVQKGTTTELKIFTGKVYTADLDGRNNTMKVVAYDALYRIFNADVTEWYNSLNLPMAQVNYRNSFFAHFGITQKAATLPFDSKMVRRTIGGEEGNQGILGRDIIKPLCEGNVRFGHIDYDGEFVYQTITQNNRTVPLGEVNNMVKAKYVTSPIDKVIVRMDEEDIGAVSGYGSNAYIIEGNMLFYGLSASELQEVADTIFSELEGFSFQPLESEQQYNPIYELGDLITVPDGFGNTYQTIILQRTTDLQREVVKSQGLSEYSQSASYSNSSLVALLGKTNRLYRDVEQTRLTIADVERGLQSEITQTAEGLQIQIDEIHEELDGDIAYYEREGVPTLLNYPYWDFTTSFKCDGTKKCAPLYNDDMSEGGNQYPHFYYSEQDRKDHKYDICYDTDTQSGYRFVYKPPTEGAEPEWFWEVIADTEYNLILSRVASLEATAEQLTTEYTEISASLSGDYYTKTQTDSKISQSASQIQTTVSATYATKTTTNSLQSQITQQAGLINAKVSSTGGTASSFAYALQSTQFKLTSNNTDVLICDSGGLVIQGNATITGTIRGATIVGSTLQGVVTMAQNSQFSNLIADNASITTMRLTGRTVNQTLASTFYAFSSNPTMKYDSSLNGYVPVFSSAYPISQYKGLAWTSGQSAFLTVT